MLQTSSAQALFETERRYINYFFDNLDCDIVETLLQQLLGCSGHVICSGVGKSGIIAQKIATTMTSTGTPALYLSPTDAVHGDLGIVGCRDIVLLFSKSGESDELLNLVPYLRNKGAEVIAVVSNSESRLAKACSLAIELPLEGELCPFGLAPTTSAALQLIFGDVLAVLLMKERGFSLDDYALNHPSGRIGKRITMKVKDLMLAGEKIPLCNPTDTLADILVELSNKRCGCLLVVDDDHQLLGIFTDGDLRRALQAHKGAVMSARITQLMTPSPKTIFPEAMAWDAMKIMEADQKHPITVLPVVDEQSRVVGLIKMHDILQSGL